MIIIIILTGPDVLTSLKLADKNKTGCNLILTRAPHICTSIALGFLLWEVGTGCSLHILGGLKNALKPVSIPLKNLEPLERVRA